MHKQAMIYYSFELHRINLLALGGNALFIALHIPQAKYFYDGLAQTVSNLSSQFAIIFFVGDCADYKKNPRRNLIFDQSVPIKQAMTDFLKHYHGYYFSWEKYSTPFGTTHLRSPKAIFWVFLPVCSLTAE